MERPDPGTASTPAEFARVLKALKVWSGDPALRQLAKLTGIPTATLSDAMSARKALPQLGLVRTLVPVLDPKADLDEWSNAWRRARAMSLAPDETTTAPAVRPHTPRQLPPDPPGFVGRHDLLARLDTALATRKPSGISTATLTGSGGIGKTSLAVHWAHRVADRFDSGQLYIDLAGFGPGEPREPGDVIAGFLRALGIPATDIPADPDERLGLYRSTIADKRLLILCDNASDAEQVRPLLPTGPGSFALVTTRRAFTGFAARDGAVRIPVETLPTPDALQLATELIGPRVTAEPEAAQRFLDLCDRLPLALRIAARQVGDRPDDRLATVVADMADQGIGFFTDPDDPYADVIQLFSWSLHRLPDDAAGLFPLLGLHPGRHMEVHALAALAGETVDRTRRRLAILARANLVDMRDTHRFTVHDLLLSYARRLSESIDPPRRNTAGDRLADYYIHSVANAKDTEFPWDRSGKPRKDLPGEPGSARDFADAAQAVRWNETELDNLVLLAAQWRDRRRTAHLAALSALLWRRLTLHGYHDAALAIHTASLEAAIVDDDSFTIGAAEFRIGDIHWRTGDLATAIDRFQSAIEHKKRAGHRIGVVHALSGLGCVHITAREYSPALAAFTECLDTARAIGAVESVTVALHNLAEVHMKLSQWDEAADRAAEAVELAGRTDQRTNLVGSLALRGRALARRGDLAEASVAVDRAQTVADQIDSQELLAETLCAKTVLLGVRGRRAEARGQAQRAWRIYSRLGMAAGQAEAAELIAEFED